MPSADRPIRVLTNDDGWILGTYGPPIRKEDLCDRMVAPHEGTPFDTFIWNVGGREVFSYETEVGERFAWDVTTFADPAERTRAENLHHLVDSHGGPLALIAQSCHRIGMKFFASLRMNTHYNTDDDALGFGRFRREHPELLIGRPGEELHPGDPLWGLRTGKDFAFPAVRDLMNSLACELVERCDVDGIELDFMRHPGDFRPQEAYANRYLLTDMVQQLRRRMDAAGKTRGCKLELAVRVAPTLDDSARLGMAVEEWIAEGLVDLVIVGLGFNPFEARVAEFAGAAAGTGCRILGCFEALRPVMDTEVLRAIAARYWDEGADGLVNIGLGRFFRNPDHAPFSPGYLPATVTFDAPFKTRIAGLEVEFYPAPSDATDSVSIWFPELDIAVNNLLWPAFFNIFAIRGEEYRDPRILLRGLDQLHGFNAEHQIATHGPPLSGRSLISATISRYRDAIQFVFDQTVRGANRGLSLDELIAEVCLPELFDSDFHTQQLYGLVEHHIRQVYTGLFGWFDEDESKLFPTPQPEKAAKMIAAFGGIDASRQLCDQALGQKDYRWSIEVASHLVKSQVNAPEEDRLRLAAGLKGLG